MWGEGGKDWPLTSGEESLCYRGIVTCLVAETASPVSSRAKTGLIALYEETVSAKVVQKRRVGLMRGDRLRATAQFLRVF